MLPPPRGNPRAQEARQPPSFAPQGHGHSTPAHDPKGKPRAPSLQPLRPQHGWRASPRRWALGGQLPRGRRSGTERAWPSLELTATGSPAHSGTWSHRGASAHAGASREPRVRGHGDGLLGEAAQRAAAGGAGPRPHPAGPDGVAEPRLRGGLPRGLHAPEAHLAGEGRGQSPTALAISLLSVGLQHPGPPRPPSNPPPSSLPPQDQPGKVAPTGVHGADSWPKPVSSLL